jgi:hypothetical protein
MTLFTVLLRYPQVRQLEHQLRVRHGVRLLGPEAGAGHGGRGVLVRVGGADVGQSCCQNWLYSFFF